MRKMNKMRRCNLALLVLTVLLLASCLMLLGLQGEPWLGLDYGAWVWIHVALALAMMGLIVRHLYLHFGRKRWLERVRKLRSHVTRLLFWLGVLAAVSGLVVLVVWLVNPVHGPAGKVHAWVALIFLLFTIGHIVKRWRRL